MKKLMTQLSSVQLIEAALWRELGSTEPQSQDALRQALADAVSRWLLIRSTDARHRCPQVPLPG